MKIIVTAGGSGGHIYPALAIINKFKEHEKELDILYIGTHNRMEKEIIPKHNIRYESIEIYGFSKTNILRDIKNVFLIQKAIKRCKELMKDFKPDIVLGIGGYVTYPVIKAANDLGIKTFIHEQNSLPGKTNRMIGKQVDLIGISFPESASYFPKGKTFYCGNPCGENALAMKPIEKESLRLSKNKKLVVIVAGSLGSSSLNAKMKEVLINCGQKSYEIVYITGKAYYDDFIKDLEFPNNVKVVPYLDNLAALFKNTDLIVARAGASTMSEIMALGLPAIFIPSPYVANNHQYYNALELKEKNAADMIEEKNITPLLLLNKIDEILNDKKLYEEMKKNVSKLGIKNSSEQIYQKVKELVK